MNKVLQLGFQSFTIFARCFLPPRNPRVPLSLLRAEMMGSKKRPLSNASRPVSLVVEESKGKKLKAVADAGKISEKSDAKDSEDKFSGEEIQLIQEDLQKIETMTVQQLRSTLRRLGVPAKGLKRDLVSALQCYFDKNANGENSHVAEDEVSAPVSINLSTKRRTKKISVEDSFEDVSVSEVSSLKHRKSRVKQSAVEGKKADVSAEAAKGKKLSQTKKGASSSISQELVHVDGKISVPMNQSEPWTVLAHKKPQKGWVPYNPRTMRPSPPAADSKCFKLMSWNVNGLRALLKLEGFSALELAQRENFDVLCLQETKLQDKDVEAVKETLIDGYDDSFWSCSVSKLGYSGTAIISRIKPLSVKYGLGISDHDSEGRVLTMEFDSFFLVSAYVPNSGDGLRRLSYRIEQWDPALSNHMKELEKSKPVILTGDLNCAHEEIDIYNPAGNKRSAGFTIEERQSFGANFLAKGFVDTFRRQHPGVVGYTYWGYRHGSRKTNKGWRLDYFLASESIADKVHDSYILPDVTGSDHCPIGLILKL